MFPRFAKLFCFLVPTRSLDNSVPGLAKNHASGSIEGGHYDGYYGDSGVIPTSIHGIGRTSERNDMPSYTDTILKSSMSQSITYHLGGPVTQPSTIIQLRREAMVFCRPNITVHRKNSFITCNVTECLFDLVNDPCETKNIAQQYPRVRQLNSIMRRQ